MSPKVAVIGAGIAGLAAAYRLRETGIESVVFDKESFVGGRMSSEVIDGFVIDKAAYTWPEHHKNLTAFLSSMGMIEQLVQTPGTSSTFAGGSEYPIKIGSPKDFLTYKLLSLKNKKDMIKLYLYAQSLGGALDLTAPTERTFELEQETAADYILRNYDEEILEHAAWPIFCEILLGAPEYNSKVPFLATLKNVLWFKIFNLTGGIGALTQALAARLDVRLGSPVEHVSQDSSGAEFILEIGGMTPETLRFDAVIFAVPPPLIPDVFPEIDPELGPMLQRIEYSKSIVTAIALNRAYDGTSMINNLCRDRFRTIATLVYDRHKGPHRVPDGSELITAVLCENASNELFTCSDNEIADAVLKEAEAVLPGASRHVLFTRTYRWPFGAVQFPCGAIRHIDSVRALTKRQPGRIAFAGDGYYKASLETSFNTGVSAADKVAGTLRSGAGDRELK
jgi:oxygen-dependent protoporphyrinogen oxidase